MKIIDFLSLGEANAISMTELSIRAGLSKREARRLILQARRNGTPVCSGDNGYFLPRNSQEAMAYYRAQTRRMATGRAALLPVKRFIDQHKNDGQLYFSDFPGGAADE